MGVYTRRDEAIAQFLDAVDETSDLWRSLDIRVIAVRIGSEWHALMTRGRLDAREPEGVPRLHALPSTQRLVCFQDVRAASALPVLIKEIQSGMMLLAGHEIRVQSIQPLVIGDMPARSLMPYEDGYASCPGTVESVTPTGVRTYVGHVLCLRSANHGQILSHVDGGLTAIDRDLFALERPWNGVAGVARLALWHPRDPNRSEYPAVEIAAPLGVAFDRGTVLLESGVLTGVVTAASKEAALRCSIGVITESDDGGYETRSLGIGSMFKGRGERRALLRVQLGRRVRRATVLLRVGPHLVEVADALDRVVHHRNPHLSALLYTDPDLAAMRAALALTEDGPKRTKETAHYFERAVARLFSLAGFAADSVDGFPGVQHAVDVLARTTDGRVIVPIECTIGALNAPGGKPNRLMARANGLRKIPELQDAEVLPIMVTSYSKDALSGGDREFVAHSAVPVLCQEQIQELLKRILAGATQSDVIQYCREQIPQTAASTKDAFKLSSWLRR